MAERVGKSHALRAAPLDTLAFALGAACTRAGDGLVDVVDDEVDVHGRPVAPETANVASVGVAGEPSGLLSK